jgi:hypothetical protein
MQSPPGDMVVRKMISIGCWLEGRSMAKRFAQLDRQVARQLVQGPAAELVCSPSERIDVPVVICPHVYDRPPQHNSNGKLLQWNQNKQTMLVLNEQI